MRYIFKGRLCGYICPECPEPLSQVKVRLYRSRAKEGITVLAAAAPKDTFAILSDDDVKQKASSLLAETTTGDDGSFSFELGDEQKYGGEAFEIDVYCGTVPHRKPTPKAPQPLQFSITTLQPAWRNTDNGLMAAFEYCIPWRYWCSIRHRFGAWVICGIVVDCEAGSPIAGVKVRAFDTDWLQDDDLGSALTDGAGKFRIDYLPIDFKQTPLSPWINLELVGGPDVYFRVETPGGTVLLAEPRSQGRTPGRDNIGPCFCVRLCLKEPPPQDGNPIPLFTHVGEYRVDPIYNDFTSDGLTTAGNYAFTDTIPLIGLLPNGSDPDALEYHFRWGEYNPAGTVLGPVSDMDASQIAPTVIGQLEYFDWDGVSAFVLRSANYWVNNPGAPTTVIHRNGPPDISIQLNQVVKAGGWIEVPRQNNLVANGNGLFVGGFVSMVELDTTKLTFEQFDVTTPAPPLKAGDSLSASQKSRMHRFKLFFEARKVGTVPILAANVREKIVMSNTHYIQQHHPNWGGFTDNERAVVLIDAKELAVSGGGCGKITTDVHALFTSYHPFLGSAQVYIEGPTPPPALPPAVNPPISADGETVSPAGGQDFNLAPNPDCAYILWIKVTLNLTYGYGAFLPDFYDHVAFCKGK